MFNHFVIFCCATFSYAVTDNTTIRYTKAQHKITNHIHFICLLYSISLESICLQGTDPNSALYQSIFILSNSDRHSQSPRSLWFEFENSASAPWFTALISNAHWFSPNSSQIATLSVSVDWHLKWVSRLHREKTDS